MITGFRAQLPFTADVVSRLWNGSLQARTFFVVTCAEVRRTSRWPGGFRHGEGSGIGHADGNSVKSVNPQIQCFSRKIPRRIAAQRTPTSAKLDTSRKPAPVSRHLDDTDTYMIIRGNKGDVSKHFSTM